MATRSNTGNTFDHDYRHLRLHLATIRIMYETITSDDELDYDEFRKEFLFVLVECKKLLDEEDQAKSTKDAPNLRTTHGTIPSLFFTATRCRDLSIRKQAIELLHSTARTERGWSSCMATSLARFVVEQEHCLPEPMTHSPSVHGAVPVRRIRLESVSFSSMDRKASITYFHCHPPVQPNLTPDSVQLPMADPQPLPSLSASQQISPPTSSSSNQSPNQEILPPSQPAPQSLLQATIPYIPTAAVERDGVTATMANKVLHAFGHTGIVLYSPKIACHCA